jgi:molybdate transport system permease protein
MGSFLSAANISDADLSAIWITCKLAMVVTAILLLVGTPLAWWLACAKGWWKGALGALVSLPIVLPPTVIGFYMLLVMGPKGPLGQLTQSVGLGVLPFTFTGLVIASVIYSLPFVVQPLQNTMESIPESILETAATLRASKVDMFLSVVLPLAKPGFLTAGVLGFAHTVGEFGVILMIGGNIPGQTRVVSVQIYNYVEALNYHQAHRLSAIMLVFSFLVLLILYTLNPSGGRLRYLTNRVRRHAVDTAEEFRKPGGPEGVWQSASRITGLSGKLASMCRSLLGSRR